MIPQVRWEDYAGVSDDEPTPPSRRAMKRKTRMNTSLRSGA